MDVPSIPGYDVLGRIGAGGSAQVWRARRVADDLHVALKVVSTGPDRVSSALREAGLLARVRHQHVIHLYDVLPVPGDGGRPDGVALAMELAEGGSLAEVLGARDHLTPGELVTVCSPLAGALAELHRAGVVHGDISPGNVLFRADGMPLLADLGVSRVAGERRAETYGTDGMVAPEVIEGFEPTAESDVYGLGALAWRCLVADVPGWVGTRPELAELRPELPADLITLVTACLSGEPSDRPEAEEVAVALYAAATPQPVSLAPGADPAAGLTQRLRAELRGGRERGTGEAPSDEARPRRWLRVSRRTGIALAGVAAVALVAVLVNTWLGALIGGAPPEAGAEAEHVAAGEGVAATADSLGVRGADQSAATSEVASAATLDEPTGTGPADDEAKTERPAAAPGPADEVVEPPDEVVEPTDDLSASAQRLLDARAAAWRSGDPADLEAVHAAGSPAYEQEVDSLAGARDLEVSYEGLQFSVGEVAVLASGPERAVLEVEVERSDYQVVTPSGAEPHAGRSDVIELELRLVDGDWRIWGWN